MWNKTDTCFGFFWGPFIYLFDGKFPRNYSHQDIVTVTQNRRVPKTNILFWVNLSKQALTEHFFQRNIPLKFNGTIGPNFKVSFFFASDHWCYLQLAICLGLFGKCLLKRYHFQDETSWLTWFLVVVVQ